VKRVASTAFGITLTVSGSTAARSTVFSRAVFDTHTTWSTSVNVNLSSLLTSIDESVANSISEWSVNTVRRPMVCASTTLSCASVENAACACTTVTRSRTKMCRSSANAPMPNLGSELPAYAARCGT